MNKTLAITTIVFVAVVMGFGTIIPAMAVSAFGVVVSINPAGNHGMIERIDDSSGTLYQFSIPRDTPAGFPKVTNTVFFTVDPENSRHATNVIVGR